tara:strand:- start:229 stop:525 length:297 start_codon:yes stop_codon:yes gene_type:complete
MITIIESILKIKPDAQVTVLDNDIDRIKWSDNNPTNITKKQILDKQTELQTEYDNNQYQRDRKEEYPTIEDQLDDIYHNGVAGWKKTIKAIKDKYPKE